MAKSWELQIKTVDCVVLSLNKQGDITTSGYEDELKEACEEFLKYIGRNSHTAESQNKSDNTSSPKFPLLEDVQIAYEINESGDVTSCEMGAIEFAHNFISENFGR